MNGTNQDPQVQRLEDINREIARAEKEGDRAYLESVLADDLLFRRANGQMVNRRTYLESLPRYTEVDAEDVKVHLADNSAVATVRVRASGLRPDGSDFAGVFRNVRLFVPGGPEGWQCRVWINTPADS